MTWNPRVWITNLQIARNARQLEQAMHQVALSDSIETRQSLYNCFLKAYLFVPGSASLKPEDKRISVVNLQTIALSPEKTVLPVFTSLKLLKHWNPECSSWVTMKARAIFQSISAGGVHEVRVNPIPVNGKMLMPGGMVTLPEFQALGKGLIPKLHTFRDRTFDMQGPKEWLADPLVPREPLPGRVYFLISEALSSLPEVKAAYHFDVTISGGDPTPIVGYELVESTHKNRVSDLMRAISMKLKEYEDPKFGLDMAVVEQRHLKTLKNRVTPFFHRP